MWVWRRIPCQQMLTLVLLPKNLCEIKCVFDRFIPHIRLECELHFRRPSGHRGKLEEVSGDNDLSIFHEVEPREEEGTYLDSSKWILGVAEEASDSRQLVKQITVYHGDWRLLHSGTASSLEAFTFVNNEYFSTSPPRGGLSVLPDL